MNLLVIGNLSTGKTSIGRELIRSGWCNQDAFIDIDGLRREFSDGTFAGEFRAWAEFLEAVQHPAPDGSNGMYEFSGTGKNAWFVREAIRYSQVEHDADWKTVYCLCDRDEMLRRVESRGEYNIPIPYTFDDPLSSIKYMGDTLRERYGNNYWLCPEEGIRTDQNTVEECVAQII